MGQGSLATMRNEGKCLNILWKNELRTRRSDKQRGNNSVLALKHLKRGFKANRKGLSNGQGIDAECWEEMSRQKIQMPVVDCNQSARGAHKTDLDSVSCSKQDCFNPRLLVCYVLCRSVWSCSQRGWWLCLSVAEIQSTVLHYSMFKGVRLG